MVKLSLGSSNYVMRTASLELLLRGNNFSHFCPGFACLQPRFHLLGVLYWGDSQLVRGLIWSNFFTGEITGVKCTGALRRGCVEGRCANYLAIYHINGQWDTAS